jgi:CRP-like cAMP-binding protein
MERRDDLMAVQLFTGFDPDEISAFLSAARRKSVPKDHVFFGVGSENSSLFIILSGSVKVERAGSAGDIPLAILSAGQTFGEMSFMDASRTNAAVRAREPTEYYEISRDAVDSLLKKKPNLAAKLWRNLALDLKKRLQVTNELIDQYVDVNLVLLQDQSFREYYARLS